MVEKCTCGSEEGLVDTFTQGVLLRLMWGRREVLDTVDAKVRCHSFAEVLTSIISSEISEV